MGFYSLLRSPGGVRYGLIRGSQSGSVLRILAALGRVIANGAMVRHGHLRLVSGLAFGVLAVKHGGRLNGSTSDR